MFRKLSLRALYEKRDETMLRHRVVQTIVSNVCPVLVFMASLWFFRTYVWDQPITVVWK